jgi:hypothetical protein
MEPNNTQDQTPINTPIQNMVDGARRDSTVGPLIGSVIIILIILVGGLYFWGSVIVDRKNEIENEVILEEQSKDAEVEAITTQSSSDDADSIEADLNATNLDSADAEIEAVDSEY